MLSRRNFLLGSAAALALPAVPAVAKALASSGGPFGTFIIAEPSQGGLATSISMVTQSGPKTIPINAVLKAGQYIGMTTKDGEPVSYSVFEGENPYIEIIDDPDSPYFGEERERWGTYRAVETHPIEAIRLAA